MMTDSFLDGFGASFTKKGCILAEKHYPLGYFTVEYLKWIGRFCVNLKGGPQFSKENLRRASLPVIPLALLQEMKELPELVDEMLTSRAGRSEPLHEWLGRLMKAPEFIWDFILDTQKMLMQYFDNLPARKPENYALAFGKSLGSYTQLPDGSGGAGGR